MTARLKHVAPACRASVSSLQRIWLAAAMLFCTPLAVGPAAVGAAEPGTVAWTRTFGGAADDRFRAATVWPDGGALLAGESESSGAGSEDGWLVRLQPDGDLLWERTFGGSSRDEFSAVVVLPDGGALAAGGTWAGGAGRMNGWALRLDADGSPLWERTYGGPAWDYFHAAATVADGGFLLAGRTDSRGAGGTDGWLVRLDSSGDVVWERTYGGSEDGWFHAAVAMAEGGALLAGGRHSRPAVSTGAKPGGWAVRVEREGNVVWEHTIGPTQGSPYDAAAPMPEEGALLAGTTAFSHSMAGDGWAMRLDAGGNPLWSHTFGSVRFAEFNAVAALAGGGTLLAGRAASCGPPGPPAPSADPQSSRNPGKVSCSGAFPQQVGAGSFDGWVLRLDGHGNVQWQDRFGGTEWDEFHAAVALPSGGLILAGATASRGAGDEDGWIVRLREEAASNQE